MANFFQSLWIKNKPFAIILVVVAVLAMYYILFKIIFKGTFTDKLSSPISSLSVNQPQTFPSIDTQNSDIKLAKPDVPEEIGLGIVYPQGAGADMSKDDSNSFYPGNPGPLLIDYKNPESYGESSLTDPTGIKGADQGCRVLRFTTTGDQMKYQPIDETEKCTFSAAYQTGEVPKGLSFINGASEMNYTDTFNPEDNLLIQTSPGQTSTLSNCEKTYPNVVKYKDACITEGDIPYGQVVDNKVNPRLVSRWESYTGDYSREEALKPIDGVLYPQLDVLTV